MEKLLHERLREHDDTNTGSWYHTIRLFDNWELKLSKHGANSLADEIERYYIPRPRFEDGEPVQFGDEVEGLFGAHGRAGVYWFEIFSDGSGRVRFEECEDCGGVRFSANEFLKHPCKKALGQDGVEIKPGETVYEIGERLACRTQSRAMTAIKVEEWNEVITEGADGVTRSFPSMSLTHECPVFDAEGVRICKGDTVWDVNTAERIEVKDLNFEAVTQVQGIGSKSLGWYYARSLTHREPDSLERIKADRELTICEYNAKYLDAVSISMVDHLLNRAIAIIERSA